MKKILFILIVALLAGCSKDEDTAATTYEIINNSEHFESDIEYLDGTLWEVIVYHYVGDDIAKQENLPSIQYGGATSTKISIEPNIEKLQVSFQILPKDSPLYDLDANKRGYV